MTFASARLLLSVNLYFVCLTYLRITKCFPLQFQNKVWSTMEKDPLFSRGFGTPSLEEQRKLSFQRVRRIHEYDFLPDEELFRNPVKHQVLTNCLGSYDWTIAAKIMLSSEVGFLLQVIVTLEATYIMYIILYTIIIDNFCIVLFSGLHKLTVLYNILRHFQCQGRQISKLTCSRK